MEDFYFRKAFEPQGEWDEKKILSDALSVLFSEGSRFREELQRLKKEVKTEEAKQQFKEAVLSNQRKFYTEYNIKDNMKSYDTMLNLAQANICDGIIRLCQGILRDARRVAEPDNAENNSDEDNCDQNNLLIASDSTSNDDDDDNSENSESINSGITATDFLPKSRDLPGSVVISADNGSNPTDVTDSSTPTDDLAEDETLPDLDTVSEVNSAATGNQPETETPLTPDGTFSSAQPENLDTTPVA